MKILEGKMIPTTSYKEPEYKRPISATKFMYKEPVKAEEKTCTEPIMAKKANFTKPMDAKKANCTKPVEAKKPNCTKPVEAKKLNCSNPIDIQPQSRISLPDYELSQEANVADINTTAPRYSKTTPNSLKSEPINITSLEITSVPSSPLTPRQMGRKMAREDLTLHELFQEKTQEEEV